MWDQAIRAAPPGLLRELDSTVLEIWTVAKSLHEEAALKIQEYGAVVAGVRDDEPIRNPYMAILNQQSAVLAKMSSELGFSPTSRSRVVVPAKKHRNGTFAQLKRFSEEAKARGER